jgi:negative regulator of flagellin synthesis FlgM
MEFLDGISSGRPTESSPLAQTEGARSKTATAGTSSVTIAQDRTEVSSLAQSLAVVAAQPDVRQERVSALQQQIASGNYSVAAQDVADALLRSLR